MQACMPPLPLQVISGCPRHDQTKRKRELKRESSDPENEYGQNNSSAIQTLHWS